MESNDNNVYDGPIIPFNMALSGLLIGGDVAARWHILNARSERARQQIANAHSTVLFHGSLLMWNIKRKEGGSCEGGSGWNKHGTNDAVTDKRKKRRGKECCTLRFSQRSRRHSHVMAEEKKSEV